MHRVFPTSIRPALIPAALAALLLSAGAPGQQPGHDAREIAPTPGVTPVETPSSRATAARPERQTPVVSRTPTARRSADAGTRNRRGRRHDPAIAGGSGSGRSVPPGARGAATSARSVHDPLQPRDVATWILFGLLVVALGAVTIRMLRLPRVDPVTLEPIEADDLL